MNMIGSLNGVVDAICSDYVILDVNGVGYIVHLSGKALGLCSIGDKIKLLVEVHSNGRENVTQLYGFIDKEEQQCLRLLVKVSGVSYKTAMSVLSKLTPKQFYLAVVNEDKISLKVSGLGPKLVNRVITELHSKVSKFEIGNSYSPVQEDAISALVNLGYEKVLAYSAVRKIQDNSPRLETKDIIRIALKDLHEINIV